MLQDLVVAAVNQGLQKAQELVGQRDAVGDRRAEHPRPVLTRA